MPKQSKNYWSGIGAPSGGVQNSMGKKIDRLIDMAFARLVSREYNSSPSSNCLFQECGGQREGCLQLVSRKIRKGDRDISFRCIQVCS